VAAWGKDGKYLLITIRGRMDVLPQQIVMLLITISGWEDGPFPGQIVCSSQLKRVGFIVECI
jgi:hypothetical protein